MATPELTDAQIATLDRLRGIGWQIPAAPRPFTRNGASVFDAKAVAVHDLPAGLELPLFVDEDGKHRFRRYATPAEIRETP